MQMTMTNWQQNDDCNKATVRTTITQW